MLIVSLVQCLLAGNGSVVNCVVREFAVLACLGLGSSNVFAFLPLGLADAKELSVVKGGEAELLFYGVIHCS